MALALRNSRHLLATDVHALNLLLLLSQHIKVLHEGRRLTGIGPEPTIFILAYHFVVLQ